MKVGKNTETLAKIEIDAIFHKRDTRRNDQFTQIHRAVLRDAMLVSISVATAGINMAAANQHEHHLSLSSATKTQIHLPRNS